MNGIFVHIPKTAGTSFRQGLLEIIPREKIYCDYGQDAPETDPEVSLLSKGRKFTTQHLAEKAKEQGIEFILGHFPVARYKDLFPEATVISFVREPLQRCYSEYLHWQRHKGYKKTFVHFFRHDGPVNVQSRFLDGLPTDSIVGITEEYTDSVRIINKELGLSIAPLAENCFREKTTDWYGEDAIPPEIASQFYALNKEDVSFYKEQLEKFYERKSKLKFWDGSLLPRGVRKSRMALASLLKIVSARSLS